MARFPNVSCSQCGQDFGPGDYGFSFCASHAVVAKGQAITDPTALFNALGKVYEYDGGFEDMPHCTVKALSELMADDDPNEDIQFRALYALCAESIEAMGNALAFARTRLQHGNKVDEATARGIDAMLARAGLVLESPKRPAEMKEPGL